MSTQAVYVGGEPEGSSAKQNRVPERRPNDVLNHVRKPGCFEQLAGRADQIGMVVLGAIAFGGGAVPLTGRARVDRVEQQGRGLVGVVDAEIVECVRPVK